MKTRLILLFFLLGVVLHSRGAKKIELFSPDQKIKVEVSVNEYISYSVFMSGTKILDNCLVAMEIEGNHQLGTNPVLIKEDWKLIDEVQTPVVALKNSKITDFCNELQLTFKGNYSLNFRAYNNGMAYRFETKFKEAVNIIDEKLHIGFVSDATTFFPEETSFSSHYERAYKVYQLSQIADTQFCSLPVYFKTATGIRVVVTETDVLDYPGLFLKGAKSNQLSSTFPKVVLKTEPTLKGADRNENIIQQATYIASTNGTRTFPWRVFMISETDAGIVENNLAYQLASPCAITNPQWIKPGKVSWDWWNANNIYGVDFESGINTQTYKYYIDFASEFGLEYIILDEGWSKTTTNVLECAPEIDVHELVAYGKQKKVGVILWLLWKPLDTDMENILKIYKNWGIKGVKVDFMQRADQYMVNFYTRVAETASKNELLVDFHGAFKPSGLHRMYPNVLSYEGVKGLENNKWSHEITPEHDVILPFTRMTAGPMDYTPGAMDNAMGIDFYERFNRPMSQGTRAHQVAMYVVYESPLQMLADNPSNYYREEPCTRFIAKIPTTWDETKVLEAAIADYIVIARRKGDHWYIGAMTDENPRDFEIDLSFIPKEFNQLEFLADGKNANRVAMDYKKGELSRPEKNLFKIHMAPGGGYVAIFSKRK